MTQPLTRQHRLAAVQEMMAAARLDRLALATGGLHFIDGFDPVAHLTGFRALGPAVLLLEADGSARLLAEPAADEERLAAAVPWARCAAVDDLATVLPRGAAGWVGHGLLPVRLAGMAAERLPGAAFDDRFQAVTARKTAAEIAAARRATAIAEAGFRLMLELARPGLPECDLAVQVNRFMRAQGANDSFLMLNAGPRAPAVMPSSTRRLQKGDILLTELSPSVDGQFVQICRTAWLGTPPTAVRDGYQLLVEAMDLGIAAVRPGRPVSEVCAAINNRLAAAGYADYSRPPHIRRRGHGLGCGSIFPGDVALDNEAEMQTDMVFVVHPNQFLPETGYMMCGEPVRVSDDGVELLSTEHASLHGVVL
jgi:Xaa-Pro dipeptidase